MSTIANGGTRIAPRLVKEIHETSPKGGIGNLEDVIPTKIMNTLQVEKKILDHIKEGLYRVTHGENGTSASTFKNYSPEVAGKTGTVEAFYSGPNPAYKNEAVENSTFISYAPYDNPEIVVSVVAPYFKDGLPSDYAAKIAKKVYEAYFGKKSNSETNAATVNTQVQQNNRQ